MEEDYTWDDELLHSETPFVFTGETVSNSRDEKMPEALSDADQDVLISNINHLTKKMNSLVKDLTTESLITRLEALIENKGSGDMAKLIVTMKQLGNLKERLMKLKDNKTMHRVTPQAATGFSLPVINRDDDYDSQSSQRRRHKLLELIEQLTGVDSKLIRQEMPLGYADSQEMSVVKTDGSFLYAEPTKGSLESMKRVYRELDHDTLSVGPGRIEANSRVEFTELDKGMEILQNSLIKLRNYVTNVGELVEADMGKMQEDIDEYIYARHEVFNFIVHEALQLPYGKEKSIAHYLNNILVDEGNEDLLIAITDGKNREGGTENDFKMIMKLYESLAKTPDYVGPAPEPSKGSVIMDVSVGYGSLKQTEAKAEKYFKISQAMTYFGFQMEYIHFHVNLENRQLTQTGTISYNVEIDFPFEIIYELEAVLKNLRASLPESLQYALGEISEQPDQLLPFLSDDASAWSRDVFIDMEGTVEYEDIKRLNDLVDMASADSPDNKYQEIVTTAIEDSVRFIDKHDICFSSEKIEHLTEKGYRKSLELHKKEYDNVFQRTTTIKSSVPVMMSFGVQLTAPERHLRSNTESHDSKHCDFRFWKKALDTKFYSRHNDQSATDWMALLRDLFFIYDTDPETFQRLLKCECSLDRDGTIRQRDEITVRVKKPRINIDLSEIEEPYVKKIGNRKTGDYGFSKYDSIYIPLEKGVRKRIEETCGIGSKKRHPDMKEERQTALDFDLEVYEQELEERLVLPVHGKTYGDLKQLFLSISRGFTNLLVVSDHHKEYKLVHTGDIRNIIVACPSGGANTKEGDNLFVSLVLLPAHISPETFIYGMENVMHVIDLEKGDLEKHTLYISKPFRLSNTRIEGLMESLANFESVVEILNHNITDSMYIESIHSSADGETKGKSLRMPTPDIAAMNSLSITDDEREAGVMQPTLSRPMFTSDEQNLTNFGCGSVIKNEYERPLAILMAIVLNQNLRISNFLEGARYMFLNCTGTHSGVHHYLMKALVTPCKSVLDCYLMKQIKSVSLENVVNRRLQEKSQMFFTGGEMLENLRTYVHWPSKGLLGIEYNTPSQLSRELNTLFFCIKKGMHPDLLNKSKMATEILKIEQNQRKDNTRKGGLSLNDYVHHKFTRSDFSFQAIIASTALASSSVHDKQKVRSHIKQVLDSSVIAQPTFISSKSEIICLEERKWRLKRIRKAQDLEQEILSREINLSTDQINLYKERNQTSDENSKDNFLQKFHEERILRLQSYGLRYPEDSEQLTELHDRLEDSMQSSDDSKNEKAMNDNLKEMEMALKKDADPISLFKELKLRYPSLNDYKYDKDTKRILPFSEMRLKEEYRLKEMTGGEIEDVHVRDKVVNLTSMFVEEERLLGMQDYSLRNMIDKSTLNRTRPVITYDSKKQRTPSDREIYIGNSKSKCSTYVIESMFSALCKQLEGETISVPGNNKILEIMKNVKSVNQFSGIEKGGTGEQKIVHRLFANLDMTKWSPKDNMFKYMYVIAALDFLTMAEKRYFLKLILHMTRKLLYIDPSMMSRILEKAMNEGVDQTLKEMSDDFRTCYIEIVFNWFQGFFNFMSSFLHMGSALLVKKVLSVTFADFLYIPMVHSDDHLSLLAVNTKLSYDEVTDFFMNILTTVFALNTMEPSIKKSYISKDTAELVSERNVHGVQESDWSKPIMAAESALPCTSIKDDMSAVLSKLQDAAGKGAPSHVLKTVLHRHTTEVREIYGLNTSDCFSQKLGVAKERLPQFMGGDYHGTVASLILGGTRASDGYTFAACLPKTNNPIEDKIAMEERKPAEKQWSTVNDNGEIQVDNMILRLLSLGLWQTIEGSDVVRADLTGGVNPFLMTSMRTIPPTNELAYDYRSDLYSTRVKLYDERRITSNVLKPRLKHDIPTWLMRLYGKKDFLTGLKSQNSTQRMIQRRLQNKRPIAYVKKLLEDDRNITVNYYMANNTEFKIEYVVSTNNLEDDTENFLAVHKRRAMTLSELAVYYASQVSLMTFNSKHFRTLADFIYYPYQLVQLDHSLPQNKLVMKRLNKNIVKRPVYSPNISYGATFRTPITLLLQYIFDRNIYDEENPADKRNKTIALDAQRLDIELGGVVQVLTNKKIIKRKLVEQIMRSYTVRTGRVVYLFNLHGFGIMNQYIDVLGCIVGEPFFMELAMTEKWMLDKGRLIQKYMVENITSMEAAKVISNIVSTVLVVDDRYDENSRIYEKVRNVVENVMVQRHTYNTLVRDMYRKEDVNLSRIMLPIMTFMGIDEETMHAYEIASSGRLTIPPGKETTAESYTVSYTSSEVVICFVIKNYQIRQIRLASSNLLFDSSTSSAFDSALDKLAYAFRAVNMKKADYLSLGRVRSPAMAAPGLCFIKFNNIYCGHSRFVAAVSPGELISGVPCQYIYKNFKTENDFFICLPPSSDYKGMALLADKNNTKMQGKFRVLKEHQEAIEPFYLKRYEKTAYASASLGNKKKQDIAVGINGMFSLSSLIATGLVDWIPDSRKELTMHILRSSMMSMGDQIMCFMSSLREGWNVNAQLKNGLTLGFPIDVDLYEDVVGYTILLPNVMLPCGTVNIRDTVCTTFDLAEEFGDMQDGVRSFDVTFSTDAVAEKIERAVSSRVLNTAGAWQFLYKVTKGLIVDDYYWYTAIALGALSHETVSLFDLLVKHRPLDCYISLLSYPEKIAEMIALSRMSDAVVNTELHSLRDEVMSKYNDRLLPSLLTSKIMSFISDTDKRILSSRMRKSGLRQEYSRAHTFEDIESMVADMIFERTVKRMERFSVLEAEYNPKSSEQVSYSRVFNDAGNEYAVGDEDETEAVNVQTNDQVRQAMNALASPSYSDILKRK